MIVSHEHRFVFLKTHKTASSTIEAFLAKVLGPDAVVATQIDKQPVRQNAVGRFNPVPELMAKYVRRDPAMSEISLRKVAANLRRGYRFYNHMPAVQARARLGTDTWDRYHTFCFERNPWDKSISQYYYRHRYLAPDEMPPFAAWVRERTGLPRDWHTYTIDGAIAVDFVGRYERLEEDLGVVLRRVGLDVPIELGRALGEMRRWEDPPYTPELDAVIEAEFANEIATFGYARPAEQGTA